MEDKIRQKTVVGQIMERIRALILSKEYNVGDRLPTEAELAEKFGTGRSSVREAIKVFNYLGVLESSPAKGTYLAAGSNISREAVAWSMLLGENDYRDIIETRGAMELWGILNILRKEREGDCAYFNSTMEQLEEIVISMARNLAENDLQRVKFFDYSFHSTIIACAENQIFDRIYSTLESFMFEQIEVVYKDYTDFGTLVQNHQVILDAIKRKDENGAVAHSRNHIANTKNSIRSVLSKKTSDARTN